MKSAILMVMVATVASQNYGSYNPYGQGGGGIGGGTGGAIVFPNHGPVVRPVRPIVGQHVVPNRRPVVPNVVRPAFPSVVVPQNQPATLVGGCITQTSGLVHASCPGISDYHFSWLAGLEKDTWQAANLYCARLGQGWQGISIEGPDENKFVKQTIANNGLTYIWTSGQTSSSLVNLPHARRFVWGNNLPVEHFTDWSPTGFNPAIRQPDNRENNVEDCLAILNNFYNDGITWHDIACHHTKPIICERSVTVGAPVSGHISSSFPGPGPVPVNPYGK